MAVVISFSFLGYLWWYARAVRDCARLQSSEIAVWPWLAALFPGALLVLPYFYAQAKLVARVEIATARPLKLAAYLAVCAVGCLMPPLMPLVLQSRLNSAARRDPAELRSARHFVLARAR